MNRKQSGIEGGLKKTGKSNDKYAVNEYNGMDVIRKEKRHAVFV